MKKLITFLILLLSIAVNAQTDCGKDLKEAFQERYYLKNQEEVYNHFQSFLV